MPGPLMTSILPLIPGQYYIDEILMILHLREWNFPYDNTAQLNT